jgi:hypothetical protein
MHHKNSAAGKCPVFSEIVLMKSTQTRFHESAVALALAGRPRQKSAAL